MYNEHELEMSIIQMFEEKGYTYIENNDEWLAEAYMETDYSTLSEKDFESTLRDYLAYKIKNGREI